jgi:hypothetical protein
MRQALRRTFPKPGRGKGYEPVFPSTMRVFFIDGEKNQTGNRARFMQSGEDF